MESSAQYFLSFSFAFFMGTGLVVGYFASQLLLTVVAYLSPWLPVWMWYINIALFAIAVVSSATSTVGVIAVLSHKARALKICWFILVGLFMIESGTSFYMSTHHKTFTDNLSMEVEEAMRKSMSFYSTNISDTQMWDEIQIEVNCCGVMSYQDWFNAGFKDSESVPDSCCLLVSEGCGQGVKSKSDPSEDIVTKGCHPTILGGITDECMHFFSSLWLPVLAAQFVLILLMLYFVHRLNYGGHRVANIFFSVSSGRGSLPLYTPLSKY